MANLDLCAGKAAPIYPPKGRCQCEEEIEELRQELLAEIAGKQDELTAGENISITKDGDTTVISATGADLSNYYTKSETYSKTQVDDLIDAIETGEFVIVQSLPATGEAKTIYLVPKAGGGYTEHIYINGGWEEIGDTDIDLSNYYTKSQTYSKTETDNLLDDKQDKLTAGNHITIAQDGTISSDYTKQDILTLLGYTEIPVSMTVDGVTRNYVFLGKEEEEPLHPTESFVLYGYGEPNTTYTIDRFLATANGKRYADISNLTATSDLDGNYAYNIPNEVPEQDTEFTLHISGASCGTGEKSDFTATTMYRVEPEEGVTGDIDYVDFDTTGGCMGDLWVN